MVGLLDPARPLYRFRALLAPDPDWQYGGTRPLKSRTSLDLIYGVPQRTEFALAIPLMVSEMTGSLLNVLEAPRTGLP